MEFEGHQFSDSHTLLDAIHSSWTGVWLQPRGDEGDATPLAWLARLGEAQPDWRTAISSVLADLVLDEVGLSYAAIHELRVLPWDPLPVVADWIVGHVAELTTRTSPADPQHSLMGELVEIIERQGIAPGLPGELAEVLMSIRHPKDGFPASALQAMAIVPQTYLERLPGLIGELADADLAPMVQRLLGVEAALSDAAFKRIGSTELELRQRVASHAKDALDSAARRIEEQLSDPGFPSSAKELLRKARGRQARRWAQIAELLGV